MKKTLILGTLVLCTLSFFSCSDKDKAKLESAKITPEAISLRAGGTQRLTLTTEPSSLQNTTVEWSSSNEDVATVNTIGVVTAVSEGTATIKATVTYNGTTVEATPCQVKVESFFEALKFTQACPYLFSVKDSSATKVVQSSSGETFTCYICDGEFLAFSEGLYLDESGAFVGASEGAYLEFESKLYWAPKGELGNTEGAFFCLGTWYVTDQTLTNSKGETKIDMVGLPGKYDAATYKTNVAEALKAFNTYAAATTDAEKSAAVEDYKKYLDQAGATISGATLEVLYYDCDENNECGYYTASGYNNLPYGLINAAQIEMYSTEDGTSSYMLPITYSYVRYKYFDSDFFGYDAEWDSGAKNYVVKSDNIIESAEMVSENGTPYSDEVGARYIKVEMMPKQMAEGFMKNKANLKAQNQVLKVK